MKMEAEIEVMWLQAKECQGDQKLEEAGGDSLLEPSEREHGLADTLISDSWHLELEENVSIG